MILLACHVLHFSEKNLTSTAHVTGRQVCWEGARGILERGAILKIKLELGTLKEKKGFERLQG